MWYLLLEPNDSKEPPSFHSSIQKWALIPSTQLYLFPSFGCLKLSSATWLFIEI